MVQVQLASGCGVFRCQPSSQRPLRRLPSHADLKFLYRLQGAWLNEFLQHQALRDHGPDNIPPVSIPSRILTDRSCFLNTKSAACLPYSRLYLHNPSAVAIHNNQAPLPCPDTCHPHTDQNFTPPSSKAAAPHDAPSNPSSEYTTADATAPVPGPHRPKRSPSLPQTAPETPRAPSLRAEMNGNGLRPVRLPSLGSGGEEAKRRPNVRRPSSRKPAGKKKKKKNWQPQSILKAPAGYYPVTHRSQLATPKRIKWKPQSILKAPAGYYAAASQSRPLSETENGESSASGPLLPAAPILASSSRQGQGTSVRWAEEEQAPGQARVYGPSDKQT